MRGIAGALAALAALAWTGAPAFLREEVAQWAQAVKDSGAKAD